MTWLTLVNPWMLAGLGLVAAPILIHLLSKRRFHVVTWAAMDFLLVADRRNRRRIRLEDLLLLLLRCLIIAAMALLVARPLWQSQTSALLGEQAALDHLVLLDDSPSMGAAEGTRTVMEQAREAVGELVADLSAARPNDTLTLILSSHPAQPLLSRRSVAGDGQRDILRLLERVETSDTSAPMEQIAAGLSALLEKDKVRQAIHIFSDFRRHDWQSGESEPVAAAAPTAAAPPAPGDAAANALATLARRCDMMELRVLGKDHPANLEIISVRGESRDLAAGVESRVDVEVANHGPTALDNVEVSLGIDGSPDLRRSIPRIEPEQITTVSFSVLFAQPGSYKVEARLPGDELTADNRRGLAAWVGKGVPLLLVQGEGGALREPAYFLTRALRPSGEANSGNIVQVLRENQFENQALDAYAVVFLCNLYRISEERASALDNWVRGGGGLVIFLGDQVDAGLYNSRLFRDGGGLLPLRLADMAGDPGRQHWESIRITSSHHPVLKVFQGAQNPFLRNVKFFQWWRMERESMPEGAQIPAALSDPLSSPLLAEKSLGRGRVMVCGSSPDMSWNNWPSDPSYVVAMLELVRHMSHGRGNQSDLAVGEPISLPLDTAQYKVEARVIDPAREISSTPATLDNGSNQMLVRFDATRRQGFYDLQLTRLDGETQVKHFAVNLARGEGDLQRADLESIRRAGGGKIHINEGKDRSGDNRPGLEAWELAGWILPALAVMLMLEQFMAWSFGRKR